MTEYPYLELTDEIQEGDEYHHLWTIWRPFEPDMIGKTRGQVFGYRTKIRKEAK